MDATNILNKLGRVLDQIQLLHITSIFILTPLKTLIYGNNELDKRK